MSTTFAGTTGKIKWMRINDSAFSQPYGAPGDQLDTQVVVVLDTHSDMGFGFDIKGNDPNLPSRLCMLACLRDAYLNKLTVGLGYDIEEGKKMGLIRRVDCLTEGAT